MCIGVSTSFLAAIGAAASGTGTGTAMATGSGSDFGDYFTSSFVFSVMAFDFITF